MITLIHNGNHSVAYFDTPPGVSGSQWLEQINYARGKIAPRYPVPAPLVLSTETPSIHYIKQYIIYPDGTRPIDWIVE